MSQTTWVCIDPSLDLCIPTWSDSSDVYNYVNLKCVLLFSDFNFKLHITYIVQLRLGMPVKKLTLPDISHGQKDILSRNL